MIQVYLTKDGCIFNSDLSTESNGIRYMIDATDIADIKAYPLQELTTLGEKYDFIRRYLPDFDHRDEVAWLDNLDCLIEGECDDDEKFERLTAGWGSDINHWKKEYEILFQKLYDEAVKNYKSNSIHYV